jgi:hypothetical protein
VGVERLIEIVAHPVTADFELATTHRARERRAGQAPNSTNERNMIP